jgi:predicted ATP-dependent serine protease
MTSYNPSTLLDSTAVLVAMEGARPVLCEHHIQHLMSTAELCMLSVMW